MKKENRGIKNYKLIIAAVLLQFPYGIAYIWSVLQPYVKERFHMGDGSANMPFGILLAAFSLGNVIAGILQKRYPSKRLIIIGNILLVGGMVLTAFIPETKGQFLNMTYGVITGLGAGVGYNTTIATVQGWFPENKGKITGILICATGAFGLIMNPVASLLLSTYSFRLSVLCLTMIIGLCLAIGSILIENKVEENDKQKEVNRENDYTFQEVIKYPQYYSIIFMMMLAVPGYMLISPMMMGMGSQKGLTAEVTLLGVMLLAVMNSAGRLLAPWLSDRTGRKNMLFGLFLLNIGSIAILAILDGYWFMLGVALIGLSYGSFMGMYPTITADYFGSKHNGINYGVVMMGYGITSLSCPYLVKWVQGSAYGNNLSLLIAAGASVVGMLYAVRLKRPRRDQLKDEGIQGGII